MNFSKPIEYNTAIEKLCNGYSIAVCFVYLSQDRTAGGRFMKSSNSRSWKFTSYIVSPYDTGYTYLEQLNDNELLSVCCSLESIIEQFENNLAINKIFDYRIYYSTVGVSKQLSYNYQNLIAKLN